MHDATLIPAVLIDAREYARLMSVSKQTILRWLSDGRLPEPIRLTSQCYRWRRDTVLVWIADGCPRVGESGAAREGE